MDRRDPENLDYETFVDTYLAPNEPCLISSLVEGWPAFTELNSGGKVDIDYLEAMFGEASAPVHATTVVGANFFGGVSKPVTRSMTVMEYCSWWRSHHTGEGDGDGDGDGDTDGHRHGHGDNEEGTMRYLYLKDWKFTVAFPSFHLYTRPVYFKEDWLNDVASAYKFVYLGPKHTCTRMHADVLRSYSWSSNVCGRKRWYLVRPEHTHLLYDVFGRVLCPHLHFDLENALNAVLFPGLKFARKVAFEVIQETGETIFVPSGWHHTVENLEDTLSINHNWLNGYNLKGSWEKLKRELLLASERRKADAERKGISDFLVIDTVRGAGAAVNESPESFDDDSLQASGDLVLLYDIIAYQVSKNLPTLSSSDLTCMRDVLSDIIALFAGGEGGYEGALNRRTEWKGSELLKIIEGALG